MCVCVFVCCDIVDLYFDPPVFGKENGMIWDLDDFFDVGLTSSQLVVHLRPEVDNYIILLNSKWFSTMFAIHRNPCHIVCNYACSSN